MKIVHLETYKKDNWEVYGKEILADRTDVWKVDGYWER